MTYGNYNNHKLTGRGRNKSYSRSAYSGRKNRSYGSSTSTGSSNNSASYSKPDEMSDVMDDTPDLSVRMTPDAYERIQALMSNVQELVDGSEIGAWLTGEWDEDTLRIDGVLIPEQEVSSSQVDIGSESIRSLLKEHDPSVTNRIIGHWHIHPFGTGTTDWSGIDETKIGKFMRPCKGREKFAFLLSSFDWMKARVEARVETEHPWSTDEDDDTSSKRVCMDGIQVERIQDDRESIVDELREEIDEKVEQVGQSSKSSQDDDDDDEQTGLAAYTDVDGLEDVDMPEDELREFMRRLDMDASSVGDTESVAFILAYYDIEDLQEALAVARGNDNFFSLHEDAEDDDE